MANAHELMQQVLTGGFRDRVRYCAIKAALAVMAEGAPSAERLAYAKAVLLGTADIQALTIGVLTNGTIAAAGDAATDNDVQFTVNAMFDAFAKAGVKVV